MAAYPTADMAPLLFLDIETVPCASTYAALPDRLKPFWERKATQLGASTAQEVEMRFFERAGIFAEFGKVIVVALGYLVTKAGAPPFLRVKGLASDDEASLLRDLKVLLMQFSPTSKLCAHNGKEFDFPYLARRMTVHGIALPPVLDIAGKKPWEVAHLDTMELWKFGDRKNFTSLDLLATLFDIPSSKALMHGSEVAHYYYKEQALDKIKAYCVEDVVVTAQLYRRLTHAPLLPATAIQRS